MEIRKAYISTGSSARHIGCIIPTPESLRSTACGFGITLVFPQNNCYNVLDRLIGAQWLALLKVVRIAHFHVVVSILVCPSESVGVLLDSSHSSPAFEAKQVATRVLRSAISSVPVARMLKVEVECGPVGQFQR